MKKKKYLKRLKDPATIMGITSYLIIILTEFDVKFDNQKALAIIKSVLGIFVLIGILNNPDKNNQKSV